MVEFDLTSDGRFDASLQQLGEEGELDVLSALDDILARSLTWEEFVDQHGWEPVALTGSDTYPGAIELFSFALKGPPDQYYQVVASTIDQVVVICAVARRFSPV